MLSIVFKNVHFFMVILFYRAISTGVKRKFSFKCWWLNLHNHKVCLVKKRFLSNLDFALSLLLKIMSLPPIIDGVLFGVWTRILWFLFSKLHLPYHYPNPTYEVNKNVILMNKSRIFFLQIYEPMILFHDRKVRYPVESNVLQIYLIQHKYEILNRRILGNKLGLSCSNSAGLAF